MAKQLAGGDVPRHGDHTRPAGSVRGPAGTFAPRGPYAETFVVVAMPRGHQGIDLVVGHGSVCGSEHGCPCR